MKRNALLKELERRGIPNLSKLPDEKDERAMLKGKETTREQRDDYMRRKEQKHKLGMESNGDDLTKLLNQGGYGCVYYPAVKCHSKHNINPQKYVSKVVILDKNMTSEIVIGKLVADIPNFDNYFAPVVNNCDIDLNRIDEKLQDKYGETCGIIEKFKRRSSNTSSSMKEGKMAMVHVPYIHDGDFTKNIIGTNRRRTYITIVDSYNYLLYGLYVLNNRGILHYDLKPDNVLYNKYFKHPVIIDFGLSIDMNKVNRLIDVNVKKRNNAINSGVLKLMKSKFYIYAPEYYLWCPEIHLICFLLHGGDDSEKDDETTNINDSWNEYGGGVLTRETISDLCETYVDNNKAFKVFDLNFRKNYKELCMKYYEKFIGVNEEEVILYLLEYWDTWDNYSLSIMYIKLLNTIFGSVSNNTVDFFYELLVLNLHPNPERRRNKNDTITKMREIYYQNDTVRDMLIILGDGEDYDRDDVIKTIQNDINEMNTIISMERVIKTGNKSGSTNNNN